MACLPCGIDVFPHYAYFLSIGSNESSYGFRMYVLAIPMALVSAKEMLVLSRELFCHADTSSMLAVDNMICLLSLAASSIILCRRQRRTLERVPGFLFVCVVSCFVP